MYVINHRNKLKIARTQGLLDYTRENKTCSKINLVCVNSSTRIK